MRRIFCAGIGSHSSPSAVGVPMLIGRPNVLVPDPSDSDRLSITPGGSGAQPLPGAPGFG